uniref:Mucin 5AC, oligomeric mucus/gel-forming n=1 Tax=Theropithecus gelada TaxID=9565 RepID=A0A8D2G0B7_THEGE
MGVGQRKLAPLWTLALALACTRHTGTARSLAALLVLGGAVLSGPQGEGDAPKRHAASTVASNPAHNGRVCSTWGDFHYKTFDGDVFRFPGLCNYVFSEHCGAAYEDFNVQLRRSQESAAPTLSRVLMKVDGVVIQLTNGSVLVNGRPVLLPFSQSGVFIQQSSSYTKVEARLGLVLMWNHDDSLLLELDAKYANETCGLCGDFNGMPVVSELLSHNIKLTPMEFGNLQKMDDPTEQCEDPVPEPPRNCSTGSGICEELLNGQLFSSCVALVDVGSYLEACRQDLCFCGGTDLLSCVCHTLAEYSRQCAHAGGLPQDWRGPDLCPQTCPSNMQYHECRSPCTDTCSNQEHSRACEDHCVAGCFCPEGTVLDDVGQTGCVPVSQCACVYNGTAYAPGATYSTDCTNCTCSGGRWSCQEVPCPGTCSVLGGAHFSTFDERHYTVHGDCSYVLTKPCDSSAFTVLAELRRCGLTDSETCLKSVTLSLDGAQTVVVIKASGEVFLNQIYTQLPISAANVTIFRPSTFFIIAQTNLGLQLDLQLVPTMQLFVRLAPKLRGQTCGLCGNFNSIQADDFRTLSGVVEATAAAFFNTFKTQAACPNIRNSFEDPCSLSVENEKYAQHWCSQLTDASGPFSRCHAAVKPDTYYSNCMFDTCNCERSEDCLCAVLSSYVHACAAKGVQLSGWRNGVCTKPMTTCPKSMTYHYNVSTCQPTCRSLSEGDITCSVGFIPVDGCICPEGTFLDDTGKCVQASNCPCYHRGSVIPNGESVHDSGAVCTCTHGKLSCIGGQAPTPVCAAPMVFFDCHNATPGDTGAGCQKSCHTLDMTCYSPQCVPGCVCPDGLVADGEGNCITVEDCPCVHNEASYRAGQTIRVGCNTCTCDSRMWRCTDNPCLATCAVYGDGHYLTFDGQSYSFNGDCEYMLVQNHCGGKGSAQDSFRVVTENVPCGTTGTTCSKAIKIFLGGSELKLSHGKVEVTGTNESQEVPYTIRQMGIYLVVDTDIGLVLLWDKKTSIFINLSPEFKSRVCGLCGNFDDIAVNDFATRSRSVVGDVLEFGNSWKLSPSCPDALAAKDPCTANPFRKSWAQKQCSILHGPTFAACHAHVEPARYYEACVNDACACDSGGDCECFCTAVAAYAQACHEAGLCVSWRTPSICPLFCDYYNPEGKCEWHYQPCGAPCLRTCQNPRGDCLQDVRGLEGCYPKCPPEAPIFDEDKMQCVATCPTPPPPPLCHVHGKSYRPGAVVPSDKNCHSCLCTERGVECTYEAEACVCTYDGQRFHPGDVIYHTTDGTGGCISARCGANGTIERRVYPCSPTTPVPPTTFSFSTPPLATSTSSVSTTAPGTSVLCTWTEWIDGSYPDPGINGGDFDTFQNLRDEGYKFCENPQSVECRAVGFPNTPLADLGQDVICSRTEGLICLNKNQLPPICYNYEIRIQCCKTVNKCRDGTRTLKTITTTRPTPHPAGAQTQTTFTTHVPSASTEQPTATSRGGSTATSVTQDTHNRSVTRDCHPQCTWTKWFDVDFPSPGPHGGDEETYNNIIRSGEKICRQPEEITRLQCRAASHPEVSIEHLGQVVQCSREEGLVCRNQDQQGPFKMCLNYEVRVLCCETPKGCPVMSTPVTAPSTPSGRATSPTQSTSSWQKPRTTTLVTISTTSTPQTSTISTPTTNMTSAPTPRTTSAPTTSTTSVPTTSTSSAPTTSTTSAPTTNTTSAPTPTTTSAPTKSTTFTRKTSTTSAPTTSKTSASTTSTTSAPIPRAISAPTKSTTYTQKTSTTSTPKTSTTSAPTPRTSAPTKSTTCTRKTSTTSAPITSTTSVPTTSTTSAPPPTTTSAPTKSTTCTRKTSTTSTPKTSTTSAPTTSMTSAPTPRTSAPTKSTKCIRKTRTTSAPITSTTSAPTTSTTSAPPPAITSGPTKSTTFTRQTTTTSAPTTSTTSAPTTSTISTPTTSTTSASTTSTTIVPGNTPTPVLTTSTISAPTTSTSSVPTGSTTSGPATIPSPVPTTSTTTAPTTRTTSALTSSTTSGPETAPSPVPTTSTISSAPTTSTTSSAPTTSTSSAPTTSTTSSPGTIPSPVPTTSATTAPTTRTTSASTTSTTSGAGTTPSPVPITSTTSASTTSTSSAPTTSTSSAPTTSTTSSPGTTLSPVPTISTTSAHTTRTTSAPISSTTSAATTSIASGPETTPSPVPTTSTTSASTTSTTSGPETTHSPIPTTSTTSTSTTSTTSSPGTTPSPVPTTSTTSSVPTISTTSSAPTTSTSSAPTTSTTSSPRTTPSPVPTTSTNSAPTTRTTSAATTSTTSGPETTPSPIPTTSTTSASTTSTTSGPGTTPSPVPTTSTISAPTTSTTSAPTMSTSSAPTTSTTSSPTTSTSSTPQTSTSSATASSTTSAPTTSTTSAPTTSRTFKPTTSTTSVPTTTTTSAPTTTTSSAPITSTTSAPTSSTTSAPTSSTTSAPTSSTTSAPTSSTTSAPTSSTTSTAQSSTTSTPIISTTSALTTSTTSAPTTSTPSSPGTTPSPVPTTSTTSVSKTSTSHVSVSKTTHSQPVTSDCHPQCTWTKWFDVDFPSPGPHGGDEETYNNIIRSGEKICRQPEEITRLQCRATSHPEVSIEHLGQVVQCSREEGLVCRNQDQQGPFKMCLNYEVRVLCCEIPKGCPVTAVTPYGTSTNTLYPSLSTSVASTSVASSSVASSSVASSSVAYSTPTCFCNVTDRLYPMGSTIYRHRDLAGHCYYALCSQDCQVVRGVGSDCPSTTLPPAPATSPWTSTSEPVTELGCPNAVPPRKKGETWATPNCSEATCEGNNIISLRPRTCPRVEKPTCANGYPALKVADQDGCCYHYQCQCVCSGWGDPHYITFDGTYYTFLDNCTYVLVQQIVPVYGHFRVLVDNDFCGAEDGLSCPKSIILEYQQDRVVLTRKSVHGAMTNEIIFNNKVVSPGFRKNGIVVSRVGIKMYATIPALGVQVMFSGLIFSVEVPFSKFANNTEGQCGTCTNDLKDECRTPGGTVVASCSEMSGLWNVSIPNQPACHGPRPLPTTVGPTTVGSTTFRPTTPPAPCPPSSICRLILSKVFEPCHAVIPPLPFYEGCTFDQCHKTDLDTVCSSLELYAALCASQDICIDWRGRTNHMCPFTCPADKVYQPCGPSNPSYCYGNDSASLGALPEAGPITEGCFCPEGMTFFSTSAQVCVPTGWCLGPHGEPVKVGHTVSRDCQECTCEAATWTLTCRPKLCPLPPACPLPGFVPVPAAPQAGQCCPQYNCACNTSHCPAPVDCPEGAHAIPTYEEGDCCPVQKCSDVCCPGSSQPGAVVSSSLCETCRCELPGGPLSDTFVVSCETQICNSHCPVGFEYQEQSGQCCGTCVQVACVTNTSGSSTHLFYPGMHPGNHCVTYECEKHLDGLVVVTTKKACPPLSCSLDEARMSKDGCCRFCPPPPLPPQYQNRKCRIIQQQGCNSSEPVRLAYCRGNCGDSSSMYSFEGNMVEHRCQCCQELRTSLRNVTLHCADGSSRTFSFTEVEQCGCRGQRCPTPGDTQHSEEMGPEQSQEAGSGSWERGTLVSPIH